MSKIMSRKHTKIPILIIALMFFCLCLSVAGVLLIGVPQEAVRLYGPPDEGLGTVQRFAIAFRLILNQKALLDQNTLADVLEFRIEQGETIVSITNRLEESGIIHSAAALRDYLIYTGTDTRIQAGEFRFETGMSGVEVGRRLQKQQPGKAQLVILAGWRVEEIAVALQPAGVDIAPALFLDFVSKAGNTPAVMDMGLDIAQNAEGYLFPGEYIVDRDISAKQLVLQMLFRFQENVSADIRSGFAEQGLSLSEGVILASMIEREAILEEEMPLIASVFYNRLAIGMKLDSDPTVQYAVGYGDVWGNWWRNPITVDDLRIDSPYNTYIYSGLPPGPICNPGLDALKAVAFPAQSNYYYFRALCDHSGRHIFAVTYDEHLNNACP